MFLSVRPHRIVTTHQASFPSWPGPRRAVADGARVVAALREVRRVGDTHVPVSGPGRHDSSSAAPGHGAGTAVREPHRPDRVTFRADRALGEYRVRAVRTQADRPTGRRNRDPPLPGPLSVPLLTPPRAARRGMGRPGPAHCTGFRPPLGMCRANGGRGRRGSWSSPRPLIPGFGRAGRRVAAQQPQRTVLDEAAAGLAEGIPRPSAGRADPVIVDRCREIPGTGVGPRTAPTSRARRSTRLPGTEPPSRVMLRCPRALLLA